MPPGAWITAAASDRLFVIGDLADIYVLRLAADGRPERLSKLSVNVPGLADAPYGGVLSPNGRLLALSTGPCWRIHGPTCPYAVVVFSLATGAITSWRTNERSRSPLPRMPAQVVAGLLRQQPQEVGEIKMTAPATAGNATFRRLPGQAEYLQKIMPWPRTEWTISPGDASSAARARTSQTRCTTNAPACWSLRTSHRDRMRAHCGGAADYYERLAEDGGRQVLGLVRGFAVFLVAVLCVRPRRDGGSAPLARPAQSGARRRPARTDRPDGVWGGWRYDYRPPVTAVFQLKSRDRRSRITGSRPAERAVPKVLPGGTIGRIPPSRAVPTMTPK